MGILSVFDVFYFAQIEMLRGVAPASWAWRGWMGVFIVPLVLVVMRRSGYWSREIFVSCHVVFYSASLLAIGLYLLCVAAGGVLLREFGNEWLLPLDLLLVLLASGLLVWLVFSDRIHRHLRIVIAKHLFKNKYDYRIEWQCFIATLANGARDNAITRR